jgi:hypothetical protein
MHVFSFVFNYTLASTLGHFESDIEQRNLLTVAHNFPHALDLSLNGKEFLLQIEVDANFHCGEKLLCFEDLVNGNLSKIIQFFQHGNALPIRIKTIRNLVSTHNHIIFIAELIKLSICSKPLA